MAFCGIGRPAKFFDTLEQAGVEAVKTRSFPDHHPFTPQDARSLIAEAKALGAGLLTTEKDLVRLKGKAGPLRSFTAQRALYPSQFNFQGIRRSRSWRPSSRASNSGEAKRQRTPGPGAGF